MTKDSQVYKLTSLNEFFFCFCLISFFSDHSLTLPLQVNIEFKVT